MDNLKVKLNSQWKQAILSTLFFLLLMHGYRYFQMDFSHDGIAFAAEKDIAWKISLGRYLQPIYWMLRGKIAAPFVVGFFSYLWLVPTIYLMGKITGISSKVGTFLLSGVVIGNISLVSANASYIHDADAFLLAMLLNTAAMYLCVKGGLPNRLGAVICICAGAALYQAYAQIFVTLTMIWAMLEMLRGNMTAKDAWKACILNALVLAVALVLYFLGKSASHVLTGVATNTTYLDMPDRGTFSGQRLLSTIPKAWIETMKIYILFLPGKVTRPYALVHGLVLIWAAVTTVYVLKKKNCSKLVCLTTLGIGALLPLGINSMYMISGELLHDLLTCALFLPQVYAIALAEEVSREEIFPKKQPVQLLALMLCFLFLSKAIWSNQMYLKKGLEADATNAIMIRILDRVEQLDGYTPGVTPVHFVGFMDDSPLIQKRSAFEYRYRLTGSWHSSALTFGDYYWTFWSYFEDVLGYPIQPYTEPLTPAQEQAIRDMSPFPAADSVQIVDGLVLIRF